MVLDFTKNETAYKAVVTTDIEPNLAVTATEGGLIQVLVNLIINASHAIVRGSSDENEIRITGRKESANQVEIKVKDTGQGIPKENLARVFDPFFTSKPVGIGSGLGLSICHEIVKSFGGTISVSSETNKGTEFRVLLPSS
jgi:signal transduction histidine kinase